MLLELVALKQHEQPFSDSLSLGRTSAPGDVRFLGSGPEGYRFVGGSQGLSLERAISHFLSWVLTMVVFLQLAWRLGVSELIDGS